MFSLLVDKLKIPKKRLSIKPYKWTSVAR